MRKLFLLPFMLVTALLVGSCLKDKLTKTYTVYEAIYREKSEVLAAIGSGQARSISNPGKIYKYGNYIFLNEVNKGVHIIDNANPANPVIKAFINIPGNIDIAVKGNTLYADLYTDMVTVDITDPLNARLTDVMRAVFPERSYHNFMADTSKYIVDWVEKRYTVGLDEIDPQTGGIRGCPNCMMALPQGGNVTTAMSPTVGVAGSMARFTIINDYLYAVNRFSLNIINISNATAPVKVGLYHAGVNIETIYPFRQKLFLGASAGMFIINISNPVAPVREGTFQHARACDPVVADDNFAFVTLRAGNFCQGTNNQLDVINVQNVMAPSLAKTYSMTNPFGLAKDGNTLFVCDGRDGLKVYNCANVLSLQMINHIEDLETYDVIAENKKLIVVTQKGLYQYDYTDINSIRLLSKISVNR
jgi:hypothetical protein